MSTDTAVRPDVRRSRRAELEALLTRPAGWRTAMALEAMRPLLPQMDSAERMLYAKGWDRQAAATAANAMLAQVAATQPSPGPLPEVETTVLVDELAMMLRRSERSVSGQLHTARWVTATAPTVFRLLQRGDACVGHALAFDELTRHLEPEQARQVDAMVGARAATTTVGTFRRLLRQAIAEVAPDLGPRHDKAKRASGIELFPGEDGMATLGIYLPATDAVAAFNELNEAADASKQDADPRTHGMRQVDAFLGCVFGRGGADADQATDPEPAGAEQPNRPRRVRRGDLRVTVDLLSLIGLRSIPAYLEGYGPVPVELARQLAADAGTVLRRIVTDPISGVVIDHGRTRYTADAELRRLLEVRDVTCRWPGCLRPAKRCDVEHCRPYDADGRTSSGNCSEMCVKHHGRKTHDGFSYHRTDPRTGETVWVTALGFTYRQAAASYAANGPDPGDTVRLPDGIPPDVADRISANVGRAARGVSPPARGTPSRDG